MRRIFNIMTELDENQVTLSPALVKHMLKHNRCKRGSLKIMPISGKMNDVDLIGLDVNPPYDVCDIKYQQSLSEVQYDMKTKMVGFQMEDPTVVGMWMKYGIIVPQEKLEKDSWKSMHLNMQVEARKMFGRWTYWILPVASTEEEKERRRRHVLWTAWLTKVGIF